MVLGRSSRRFWLCNESHPILFLHCCSDETFLYPIILLVHSILDGFTKPWAKRHCDKNDSPNKTSKLWSTKAPAFFLLLKTAKIKRYKLYCLKVLIYVEHSGFSRLFELEFHMPPNTQLIYISASPGQRLPKGCASLVLRLRAHGPMRFSSGRAEGTMSAALWWCSANFQLLLIHISQN